MASPDGESDILFGLHANYFARFLQLLPDAYTSLDTNRMMLVYFACSALDTLDKLDLVKNKQEVIDFVYSNQVVITDRNGKCAGGFVGGGFSGGMEDSKNVTKYHCAHVSMTYTALCILTILGDDFSRLNRQAILDGIGHLQQADGSFQAVGFGTEKDMRFVFSAIACCFMLQDWSTINAQLTADFILNSQSYDGGFGILPGQEAHAGAIYCAVSSLALLGRLDDVDEPSLVHFLVSRQMKGFNGRINKIPDTCYTFWVGGTLQVLGLVDLIEREETRKFLLSCQSTIGGFSKYPGTLPSTYPDPLHAHYSMMGLSLMGEKGFDPIRSVLGISKRAFSVAPFCKSVNEGPFTAVGEKFEFR
mmetsp:Transcript_21508/g.40150  ORF Transcript_21508/g.40150 Transcript_21508/m.40150 type:complete len:361 (-) Transcript_21508:393-1475(-)